MDIQAYIQSGIIESYVLGLASDDEVRELETLRGEYPEIDNAIAEFSDLLEAQAMESAVPPPAFIKEKVFSAIEEGREKDTAPVIPISTPEKGAKLTPIRSYSFWKAATAASVIFLISSGVLNFYLYSKFKAKSSDYQALLADRNTAVASNQIYQTKLAGMERVEDMMTNPDYKMVKMPDVKPTKEHFATVFWNTKDKDVWVVANKLPTPQKGKQFQLWALVDGKPVDAGMIDPNCMGACKMKNIPRAQAFAITLEKEGGSPTPDLTALFVLGNV